MLKDSRSIEEAGLGVYKRFDTALAAADRTESRPVVAFPFSAPRHGGDGGGGVVPRRVLHVRMGPRSRRTYLMSCVMAVASMVITAIIALALLRPMSSG